MGRNISADDFADCVVRRFESDTVVKPGMVLLAMVVPALLALIIVTFMLGENAAVEITGEGFVAGTLTALVTECCVVSFLLYTMTARTQSHQKRDEAWASALVGYVGSLGGDTSGLESLARGIHRWGRAPLKALSLVMWGFSVVYLMALAVMMHRGWVAAEATYVLAVFAYLVMILQFLITIGTTYGFPYRHEKAQIAFTRELSARLADVGIEMAPMERLVGKPHWIISLVLLVVTLGLFSFVMFLLSCRGLNLHLRNQWEYEDELLERILEHEGGRGVRPVEGSESGRLVRLVRSFIRGRPAGTWGGSPSP